MTYDFEINRQCQLVFDGYDGKIVQHEVELDEFFRLLISRRTLERCDDELGHRCRLFDPQSGDLFNIDETELCQRPRELATTD